MTLEEIENKILTILGYYKSGVIGVVGATDEIMKLTQSPSPDVVGDVKVILINYLKSSGADGLCHPDLECGCGIDDFIPCGNDFSECQPAKKMKCSDCEKGKCFYQREYAADFCYKLFNQ